MRCLTPYLDAGRQMPIAMSPDKRKDGNTQKSAPKPQTPKTSRKGGQPPTIRKPGGK